MNIYDLFERTAGNGTISYSRLKKIHDTVCPTMPFALLELHRRIFHLQLQLRYWRPETKNAPISATGGYIDARGNVRNTGSRAKSTYAETSLTPLHYDNSKHFQGRRFALDPDYKAILNIFYDRRLNIIFINEFTIPKWEPRSRTICMDRPTEISAMVDKKIGDAQLILRCAPTSVENQYDLWLLHRKTMVIKRQIATIIGESVGLGKTKHGSKRSGHIKNANHITKALDNG